MVNTDVYLSYARDTGDEWHRALAESRRFDRQARLTQRSHVSKQLPARIVPAGQVLDFIDGVTLRKETPEEYVRQEIEKALVREYLYSRVDIGVEFSIKMGTARKRADLVIFPDGAAHEQHRAWAVIECKASEVPPNHRTEGVAQLLSYLSACANAEFGMWTNGQEKHCFRRVVSKDGETSFPEIPDIPAKGRGLDEIERPTLKSLTPAESDSLVFAFRRAHNYIAGNQGLQKPEAFWELLKLIFCKIADERSGDLQFYATTKERENLTGQLRVKQRISGLFDGVKSSYPSIFKANDAVDLEPRVLGYIVSQLQGYSLLESRVDVKGKAYEEIVGSNLRGDRGEFFTPRNVCAMAVSMLNPTSDSLALDPSCGTGGFLISAMNAVVEKISADARGKWRDPDNPTERERFEEYRAITDYVSRNIVGIDLNPNLVKAAKMNMVMNNDGAGRIYQGNSLGRPATWNADLRAADLIGNVDLIFTNPPFGSKIPVDDPAILEQYELAHVWDFDEEHDRYDLRRPKTLQKSQPPEILFIERCVQLLKPGGKMAIVLPDAILGAPGLSYVREWILRNTIVLGSIDLHPDAFQPKNSTQTSILILEKKTPEQIALESAAAQLQEYEVFVALANHIGHDKRGTKTYVRDEQGNIVLDEVLELVHEVSGGVETTRQISTMIKREDDNTQELAEQFRAWYEAQQ